MPFLPLVSADEGIIVLYCRHIVIDDDIDLICIIVPIAVCVVLFLHYALSIGLPVGISHVGHLLNRSGDEMCCVFFKSVCCL